MSSSSSGSSNGNGEQHQQPIPVLAPADVQHAISLIQAAYAPSAATDLPQLQSLQSALLTMQRTPAAWGLVVPLLAHEDANVQFFGAHTAHAKIARGDLAGLPPQERLALRDALVGLAGVPRARVVRRKLYGALTALAIRLVPGPGGSGSGQWEGWVEGTVASLVGAGTPSAHIHEFLAGTAEDVGSANMLPQPKIQLEASLRAAAPLVLQSITAVLNAPASSAAESDALPAALSCLVAWLPNRLLPDADVARLVPLLIALLGSPSSAYPSSNPSSQSSQSSQNSEGPGSANEAASQAASTALSELLARPPSGWSDAVLLEPLLVWAYTAFPEFSSLSTSGSSTPNFASSSASPWGSASTNWLTPNYTLLPLSPPRTATLKRHAKLLVALAEAGVEWVAGSLVNPTSVPSSSSTACSGGATSPQSQGQGSGWGDRQSRAPGRWRGGCAPPSGSQTGLPHKAFVVVSGAQLGEGGKTQRTEGRMEIDTLLLPHFPPSPLHLNHTFTSHCRLPPFGFLHATFLTPRFYSTSAYCRLLASIPLLVLSQWASTASFFSSFSLPIAVRISYSPPLHPAFPSHPSRLSPSSLRLIRTKRIPRYSILHTPYTFPIPSYCRTFPLDIPCYPSPSFSPHPPLSALLRYDALTPFKDTRIGHAHAAPAPTPCAHSRRARGGGPGSRFLVVVRSTSSPCPRPEVPRGPFLRLTEAKTAISFLGHTFWGFRIASVWSRGGERRGRHPRSFLPPGAVPRSPLRHEMTTSLLILGARCLHDGDDGMGVGVIVEGHVALSVTLLYHIDAPLDHGIHKQRSGRCRTRPWRVSRPV
ncbi:hypothetical protein DFH06DRAFT_1474729 [Mycena polygramma]|nr:hypothetical protein DFH06DRAFT_1474729 [Mycena polygramma]